LKTVKRPSHIIINQTEMLGNKCKRQNTR